MNLGIEGKLALVTGSSKGIGKSIAEYLKREGVKVITVSRTEIKDNPNHLVYDLMKPKSPILMMKQIKEEFGDIDILINNIGGNLFKRKPLCTLNEWEKQFKFNIGISIQLNNIVIPSMKEKGWGRIINVSSLSSTGSGGSSDAYSSIKAALNTYTIKLSKEIAKYGIVVAGVVPSAIIYEGNEWYQFKIEKPYEYKTHIDRNMPIGRLGTPEEIASVVTFLCSIHSSYCIGTLIPVTGGR